MANDEEIYNPVTDNREPMNREAPRFNPATGISNFVAPNKSSAPMPSESDWRKQIYNEAVQLRKEELQKQPSSRDKKPVKINWEKLRKKVEADKPKNTFFSKLGLQIRKSNETKALKSKIGLLRLRNQVEAMRLRNQIKQMKFAEQMQKRQLLQTAISAPIIRQPKPLQYPAYATQEIADDIDSAFFADIGHGDNSLFGGENYYDEQYYGEDYYGTEFDTTPEYHLQIKPSRNISPLLW